MLRGARRENEARGEERKKRGGEKKIQATSALVQFSGRLSPLLKLRPP